MMINSVADLAHRYATAQHFINNQYNTDRGDEVLSWSSHKRELVWAYKDNTNIIKPNSSAYSKPLFVNESHLILDQATDRFPAGWSDPRNQTQSTQAHHDEILEVL